MYTQDVQRNKIFKVIFFSEIKVSVSVNNLEDLAQRKDIFDVAHCAT